jgi:parallel beta-helix repeat protein
MKILPLSLLLAVLIIVTASGRGDESVSDESLIVMPNSLIQDVVDAAEPGDRIIIMPGTYRQTVIIDKPGIELLGERTDAEGEAVILENPGGETNGIAVTEIGDGVRIANLTIRNFEANGIFLDRVNDFVISEVTAENNGEYGFYPIQSTNGLIENSRASGHSDAGVYVGHNSQHITIRNNVAFENVTGIEITSSSHITVVDNETYNNAAGILIGLLPASPVESVTNILISGNSVYDNNHPNFADHGLEQFVPSGSGIFLLGIDNSTIENNTVTANSFFGIALVNTGVLADLAEVPVEDIEPFPDNVRIVNNTATGNGGTQPLPDLPAGVDLLWDGTGSDNCWSDNVVDSSLNLDLIGGSPTPQLPECD